jgi:4'-phosphopantetheinyl transferase
MKKNSFVRHIIINRENESFNIIFSFSQQTLTVLLNDSSSFLHPKEKEYFNSLNFERRQYSYLIGRYVAKKGIGDYLNEKDFSKIEITPGVFQQPIVNYPSKQNIQVSIAHCQGWGAALVFPEAHPMAIDIESCDPQKQISSFIKITDQEKKLIQKLSLNEHEQYTLIWTIKEALSKVLKTGLMTEFTIFEISSIQVRENYFESYFAHFAQYKVISWWFQNIAWSIVLPYKSNFDIQAMIDFQLKVIEEQ